MSNKKFVVKHNLADFLKLTDALYRKQFFQEFDRINTLTGDDPDILDKKNLYKVMFKTKYHYNFEYVRDCLKGGVIKRD